jgi:hypothetical protein
MFRPLSVIIREVFDKENKNTTLDIFFDCDVLVIHDVCEVYSLALSNRI